MMTYQRITPWLGVGLNVIRPTSSFLSNCLVAATCLAATAHLLLADGSSLGRLDCESGHVRATAGIAWTANGVLSGQRVVRPWHCAHGHAARATYTSSAIARMSDAVSLPMRSGCFTST